MIRAAAALLAVGAVLLAARPEAAVLARVDPGWSPFRAAPADPGGRAERGARADELYRAGAGTAGEARSAYRELLGEPLDPAEQAWVRFMLGNLARLAGAADEAEAQYRAASAGPRGPWSAALDFDRAVLALEAARFGEARQGLLSWLRDYRGEAGEAVVLSLLGEVEAALGDPGSAAARFEEALRKDPESWRVRPETALAWLRLLRASGRDGRVRDLADALAAAPVTTPEGVRTVLLAGGFFEAEDDVPAAARLYARVLDQEERDGREMGRVRLQLALLGVAHADEVDLVEPYPAYRLFYRPGPALEELAADPDPELAQGALLGLAESARRDGRTRRALQLRSRAFREYPQGPMAVAAYEEFLSLLEAHLRDLGARGELAELVAVYQDFIVAALWVPARELGGASLLAAEAYEELGAPALAREVYEELRARGTRVVHTDELRVRILRTRAADGDPQALQSLAEDGGGWSERVAWARRLVSTARPDEASAQYRRAAEGAPGPAERFAVLEESPLAWAAGASAEELLDALEERKRVFVSLPSEAEEGARENHVRRVEGRARFALGEFERAESLLAGAGPDDAADVYLAALGAERSGHRERAADLLRALESAGDPVFSRLASIRRRCAELGGEAP